MKHTPVEHTQVVGIVHRKKETIVITNEVELFLSDNVFEYLEKQPSRRFIASTG